MIGGLTETQMAELNDLNSQVSKEIHDFEELADKIATLQSKIANLTHPLSIEGRVARVGAVRMALNARDESRATRLVEKFCLEEDSDEVVWKELNGLLGR